MLKKIVFLFLILTGPVAVAETESNHAIHEELRVLLQGMQKAVNEERYDDLGPFFHQNMRVTTINQEILSSREEIGQYFNRWFGPDGYLKKVDMTLIADAPTEFYGDTSFGIVRGAGAEDYVLSDKRKYPMQTRWTATVIKGSDGKWRILSLHIGANFLDNPILAEAESVAKYFALAGMIIGIVLMFVFNLVLRRKTAESKNQ